MKTAKGNLRFVVLFPSLGIAVKFARIHLVSAISMFVRDVFFLRLKKLLFDLNISINCNGLWGYTRFLFGGIKANWKEFVFFKKTKNPFCQPTYFSFFGLFNIQKFGALCSIDERALSLQLDVITGYETRGDGHHFHCRDNFSFSDGKLTILDYGSAETQKVITEFGQRIHDTFDPNWAK